MARKSQSQRLRAAIYVLWEQRGSKGDFEKYYEQCIEKFIKRIKQELLP